MRTPPTRLFIAFVIFASLASGQTTKNTEDTLKHKYHVIQVGSFEVQPGVDLPPDFVAGLPQAVASALKGSKIFQEVLLQSQTPSESTPVLRLSGTVTGFDKGSRAERYLGVGGAGAARIFVTVGYVNEDGQILYEDKVVGTLSSGLFGGASNQVSNELAKTVVATTKLVLLRPLPAPSNGAFTPATTSQHKQALVNVRFSPIKASDLSGGQQKMNELATAGYRFTDLKVTGNSSVEVTMEKSGSPPETYQYLLLHAYSPGNLQKNLNKGASDGYRMSPIRWPRSAGFQSSWRSRRSRRRPDTITASVTACENPMRRRTSLRIRHRGLTWWRAENSWVITS